MEAAPQQKTSPSDWAERFSTSLHRQRDRVREHLRAQRERLTRAEGELTVQLRALTEQLARDQAEVRQAHFDLEAQRQAMAAELAALERLRGQLDERDAAWDHVQSAAIDQQQQLLERLERQQEDMERQCRELAAAHAESAAAASGTEKQLREEVAALKTLCRDLQRQETSRDASAAADARKYAAERDALQARLAEARQDLAERDRLLAQAEKQSLALQREVAELSARPVAAGKPAADDAEVEDLRRRYAMAMDDLREVRARNEELQQQLSRSKSDGGRPSGGGQVLDWEAEKRRILASLEQDSPPSEEAAAAGDEIRQVVERTDRIVAEKDRLLEEKDREIAELRTLLENQSANVGAVAVGAAALGGMLDTDEIIREQRESLKQLQDELQKKLREAEIEASLERAKMARQRTELEERIRQFEAQNATLPAEGHPREAPQKGRWLSRLGLKEDDR